MNKLTPELLLDRWMHAAEARGTRLKTWKGVLSFWAKWMRLLLDSPLNAKGHPRCPAYLREQVESELAWALADLQYLTTMTYHEPQDHLAPPSAAKRNLTGERHPFIHLILDRRSRRRVSPAAVTTPAHSEPTIAPAAPTARATRGPRSSVQRKVKPAEATQ